MVILIKSWKNVLLGPILFLDNGHWNNPDESGNFYFSIYSCQKWRKDVQGNHLYKLVKHLASEVIRKISEWCAKKIPSQREEHIHILWMEQIHRHKFNCCRLAEGLEQKLLLLHYQWQPKRSKIEAMENKDFRNIQITILLSKCLDDAYLYKFPPQ